MPGLLVSERELLMARRSAAQRARRLGLSAEQLLRDLGGVIAKRRIESLEELTLAELLASVRYLDRVRDNREGWEKTRSRS